MNYDGEFSSVSFMLSPAILFKFADLGYFWELSPIASLPHPTTNDPATRLHSVATWPQFNRLHVAWWLGPFIFLTDRRMRGKRKAWYFRSWTGCHQQPAASRGFALSHSSPVCSNFPFSLVFASRRVSFFSGSVSLCVETFPLPAWP